MPVQQLYFIRVCDVSNSLFYSFVNSYFHITENINIKRTPHHTSRRTTWKILYSFICDCMIFPFCLYIFPVRTLRQENSVSGEHVRFCVAIAYGLLFLFFFSYMIFARLNSSRNNAHIINYKHLSHVFYWTETNTLFFPLSFDFSLWAFWPLPTTRVFMNLWLVMA